MKVWLFIIHINNIVETFNKLKVIFLGLTERAKKKLFNLMHFIPAIRNKIDQELDNINQIFEKETLQRLKKVPFVVKLPEKGLKPKEVLERVKQCVQLGKSNKRIEQNISLDKINIYVYIIYIYHH